jgi:hypothetical protein
MNERVIFTVSRTIDQFLEKLSKDTGMDRSNLIRMRLWEWYTEERDRQIEERRANRR